MVILRESQEFNKTHNSKIEIEIDLFNLKDSSQKKATKNLLLKNSNKNEHLNLQLPSNFY